MTERFRVLRLDEVDGYADEGRPRWHMIRTVLGIESFGINAWRATELGQAIIGEHDELGAGRRRPRGAVPRRCRGGRRSPSTASASAAPAGSLVYVQGSRGATQRRRRRGRHDDPRDRRDARARPSRSRRGSARPRRFASGRPASGIARSTSSTAQLAGDPGNANVLYNLACAESRGGRTDEALEHLATAVELEPRFAATAQDDPDLVRRFATTSASRASERRLSPGSLTPAARSRNAGTGSSSGRATSRTAACSGPASAPTRSSRPTASANALWASSDRRTARAPRPRRGPRARRRG